MVCTDHTNRWSLNDRFRACSASVSSAIYLLRSLGVEVACLLILISLFALAPFTTAEAQSVVGSSTSNTSTTAGTRKSFYDSGSNNHWVFFYNGSAIEYASSPNGSTWTSRGTLAYNTPNFSLTSKVISGTSYVFVVTEANSYDVVIQRGTISGTTITFDAAVTVYDGTSASNMYVKPAIALDGNSYLWVTAFKDLGAGAGERYQATAVRSTGDGSSTIAFGTASTLGQPVPLALALSIVPFSTTQMVLTVSGEGGTNILAYYYDGTTWSTSSSGGDLSWSRFAVNGPTNQVNAMVADNNGNIYIGGNFYGVGDALTSVAKWNGTSWSSLGTGLGWILSLAVCPNGDLYAGGSFGSSGPTTLGIGRIAKWNGTSWSAVGTGSGNNITALACDSSGNLYAGGGFTSIGGVAANRIAKWNGTSWGALGGGMNNTVTAIAFDSIGTVYAGGLFTTAESTTVNYIAKWNGTSWSAMGTGAAAQVNALVVDSGNNLIAGGNFITMDGISALRVAKWNGTSWSAMGSGVGNQTSALTKDAAGNIYAGGAFNGPQKWNGTSWSTVGTGYSWHFALAVDSNGNLYGGGSFTNAAGVSAANFQNGTELRGAP